MKRILGLISASVACLCVATVLAEGVGATYLVASVGLSQDKVYRLLAVLHNVDLEAIRAKHESKEKPAHSEQLSPDEVLQARLQKDLHLDLRETALDKSLLELRTLESKLKEERKRYDELKQGFDEELVELKKGALDKSLQEVQSTLEAIAPKQAKEQILQMLDADDEAEAEQAMTDVVTILKAMSLDKRKKIIAEFKSAEDSVRLHEILKEIRLGEPDVSLIQATRDQVKGL